MPPCRPPPLPVSHTESSPLSPPLPTQTQSFIPRPEGQAIPRRSCPGAQQLFSAATPPPGSPPFPFPPARLDAPRSCPVAGRESVRARERAVCSGRCGPPLLSSPSSLLQRSVSAGVRARAMRVLLRGDAPRPRGARATTAAGRAPRRSVGPHFAPIQLGFFSFGLSLLPQYEIRTHNNRLLLARFENTFVCSPHPP